MVDIDTEARKLEPTPQSTPVATPSVPSTDQIKSQLTQLWQGGMDAAGAHFEILSLQLGRFSALACLGMAVVSALLALAVYGFALLDQAFAIALAGTSMPAWFAPFLRGALYLGLPLGALALGWHMLVGYGTAEDEKH